MLNQIDRAIELAETFEDESIARRMVEARETWDSLGLIHSFCVGVLWSAVRHANDDIERVDLLDAPTVTAVKVCKAWGGPTYLHDNVIDALISAYKEEKR